MCQPSDDMTRDRLWTLLAILLPVLGATIAPLSTIDLAYQVRVGDLMRASGSVMRTDPLTFTAAGQPWLNQQWGAGVLLSLGYSIGGWAGLALFRALLVGLAVGLVFWTARRWLPVRPAALLALGAFVVGIGALALARAALRDRLLRPRGGAPGQSAGRDRAWRSRCRSWSSPGRTSTGASSWVSARPALALLADLRGAVAASDAPERLRSSSSRRPRAS